MNVSFLWIETAHNNLLMLSFYLFACCLADGKRKCNYCVHFYNTLISNLFILTIDVNRNIECGYYIYSMGRTTRIYRFIN
jgi:hypothetical protein